MRELFSPDSRAMKMMGRIGDIMILNVIFLLTCIPIFTIGAASTALYTICFRFGTDSEAGAVKSYFVAFRDNFLQSTAVWLLILAYLLCDCYCAVLFFSMQGTLHYLFILFVILGLLGLSMFCYAFPLLSQFDNHTKGVLYNSFVFSLAWFPRSLLMVVLNFFPVALIFLDPYLFSRIGLIWFILYFAVAACVNVRLLRKVFAPFMPQKEPSEPEAAEELS